MRGLWTSKRLYQIAQDWTRPQSTGYHCNRKKGLRGLPRKKFGVSRNRVERDMGDLFEELQVF